MKPEQCFFLGVMFLTLVPGCFCRAPGDVDYEDYDTELSKWREESQDPDHYYQHQPRIAGECDGGRMLFLHETIIDWTRTLYFDAETGQFLGYANRGTWVAPLYCLGQSYFPRPIRCPDGVVTEVLYSTYYEVGDVFP